MKRIFAHIGFSFAVSLIILNFFSVKWAFVFLALALGLFLVFMLVKKTRRAVSFPLVFACAAVAALIYICCCYATLEAQKPLHGASAEAEFYITDLEQENSSGTGYIYSVKTKSIDISGAPQNIKLVLYTSNRIEADYYEVLRAKLTFYEIADNAYSSYGYFGENIFTSASTYSYELTGERLSSPLRYVLYLREYIHDLFNEWLGEEYGGIAVALITGDKSGISDEILENFRVVGAVHLLAVSGLHISVLIGSFYWLMKRLAVPKVPRTVLALLTVLFYIALSGFAKSIIRAGIMMMVLFLARIFNERSDSLNSLGIAVFIICLNPFAVSDVSAQLTVTAVLGILTVFPKFKRFYNFKRKIFRYPAEIFWVSVSVFITTFPSMYFVFGWVSTIGAFVNIAMVPIAECALVLSSLLLFLSKIPFLSSVIAFLDSVSIRLMVVITEKASRLSFATADIACYIVGVTIGAVLLIFGIMFILGKTDKLKSTAALSAVLVIIVVSVSNLLGQNDTKLRVVSSGSSQAVIIYDSESAVVAGVQNYTQYYTVQKTVSSNGLYISLLIDSENSEYSRKLAEAEQVITYVCADSDAAGSVSCENFISSEEFEAQLSENIWLQYANGEDGAVLSAQIYAGQYSCSLSNASGGGDSLYTINKYGYIETRMNEWLQ